MPSFGGLMLMHILITLFLPLNVFANNLCSYTQIEQSRQFHCPNLSVEQQILNDNKQRMILLFNDGFSMELTVNKKGERYAHNFQFAEEFRATLTTEDQKLIQELALALEEQSLSHLFKLIRFFANLPADEPLSDLTQRAGEVPWPAYSEDDGDSGEVPWPNPKEDSKKKHTN